MGNQVLDKEFTVAPSDVEVKWAGFWIRVVAVLIDAVVYVPLFGISMYNLYISKSLPIQLSVTLLMILYKPFMEFRYGATLGKMAFRIKVLNKDFKKISLSQSVLRFIPWIIGQVFSIYTTLLLFQHPDFMSTRGWGEVSSLQQGVLSPWFSIISSLILVVSCVFVGFTKKKQGLHDMIAHTYCIYKKD